MMDDVLTRCWRLFMIKLWNHGLLDAKTMNDCNVVLEQYKKLNTKISKANESLNFRILVTCVKSGKFQVKVLISQLFINSLGSI
ncbi:hypothetical protein Lal_00034166 [Lupinus albus]|nr:hypothetical protein Lal_00034166 [Lupinus albus]